MKDYTKFMNWAIIAMIDRKTQDDRRSKVQVEALFSGPTQAKNNYIIRNEEIRRYILHVDELERFEERIVFERLDWRRFCIYLIICVDELPKRYKPLGKWRTYTERNSTRENL